MTTQTSIELQAIDRHAPTPKAVLPDIQDYGRPLGTASPPPTAVFWEENLEATTPPKLSKTRAWIAVVSLCGINFVSSFGNGLLTVGLPTIAAALAIPTNLLLWPNSVYFLTCGSCLLIAGSVADVLGPRRVYLPGCLLTGLFMLVSGFARQGIDLIMFRALQGIAAAMAIPSAVSIIASNIEEGTPRNVGFASIWLAMPLGFSLGLVLGGVFVNGVGWRAGFYFGGTIGLVLFVVGIWVLPEDPKLPSAKEILERIAKDIDWIGAILSSASIALLSYVLAMLSADTTYIKKATNIALLAVSLALMPAFAAWVQRQEKLGRPALIPNSLWKNLSFTSVCLMVLLCNAVINCMELFSSLFFQEVQQLSVIQASIRLLPSVLTGAVLNLLAGVFVNKVPVMASILISSGLCAISPLLMALINPAWSYWYAAFWAQLLAPMSVDILFTVGTLVVSAAFPARTQALAGAVFNTFAQLGTSIGLCLMSVISASVTADSSFANKESPQALLKGYRATFWALFAWMLAACLIGAFGLRTLGKVGVKRD